RTPSAERSAATSCAPRCAAARAEVVMGEAVMVGLGIGGLYAIAALGIITIHRGTGVLNLAQGAIGTWGAYVFVESRGWFGADAVAFAVTILAGAVAGFAFYHILIRPIRHRPHLTKMVMTLGLLAVLTSLLKLTFDTDTSVGVRSWLPDDSITILGASVGADRVILLGVA